MLLPVISKLTGVLLTYFSILAWCRRLLLFFMTKQQYPSFWRLGNPFNWGRTLVLFAAEELSAGGFLLTALFYVGLGLFGGIATNFISTARLEF